MNYLKPDNIKDRAEKSRIPFTQNGISYHLVFYQSRFSKTKYLSIQEILDEPDPKDPEKPIRLEVFYLRIDDNPTFNLKEWTISETEAEPKKFQWKSKIKKQNPPKQSLF